MAQVRFFFITVLLLRAVWVPTATEPPCAVAAARDEVCCMRHQAETGGDVIGHCGCRAAPEPVEQETFVSAPAGEHTSGAAILSGAPFIATVSSTASDTWCATTAAGGPIHSPPRLSGSGFRC
jgi:hypothetical protein